MAITSPWAIIRRPTAVQIAAMQTPDDDQPHPHPLEHGAGEPKPLNSLDPDVTQECIAFLLVPGFTHIGFASAIEPLRMANMVTGRPDYAAITVTIDGEAVAASNGMRILPDHAVDDMPPVHALFVCGANPISYPRERSLLHWLRSLAGKGTLLGGIDTGADLLARAGLLNGYRCTIHWQDIAAFIDRFPQVIASQQVFEIDRGRYTCSGGTAAMDLMLQFILGHPDGPEIASAAADLLVHDRIRGVRDRQRIPLRQRLGSTQSRLSAAVMIMEANTAEPLRLPEIATHVGISARQLERLFHDHLDCTPLEYYMELRLMRVRERLLHSDSPISEIAHQCGFRSAAHLSRRYQRLFGVPPSEDRRQLTHQSPAVQLK